jgi:hypothetical protein
MTMKPIHLLALCVLAGAAGCSGGSNEPDPEYTEQQLVSSCLEFRERACQCRHELVDPWLDLRARTNPVLGEAMTTESGREEIKGLALKEFVEDGSGPLEPRRQKCQAMLESGKRPDARSITALADCEAKESCLDWVACIMPVMEELMAPKSQL